MTKGLKRLIIILIAVITVAGISVGKTKEDIYK